MPNLPNPNNPVYSKPREKTRRSSVMQMAYARRLFNAEGITKKQIALDVGFAPSSAKDPKNKIESKVGFHNAMAQLAADSNNLALSVMEEFKGRGLTTFSNSELIRAISAVSSAWSKFNDPLIKRDKHAEDYEGNKAPQNKLRTVILQRIENQTINTEEKKVITPEQSAKRVEYVEVKEEDLKNINFDF